MKKTASSVSISDIVNQFSASLAAADGAEKKAEDAPAEKEPKTEIPEATEDVPAAPAEAPKETETAAPAVETAEVEKEKAEASAEATVEPKSDAEDKIDAEADKTAACALRKIAADAITREAGAMEKEAGAFGTLFAHAFMGELQKQAAVDSAYRDGYTAVTEKIAHVREAEKALSKASDEAYAKTAERIKAAIDQDDEAVKLATVMMGVTREAFDATMERIESARAKA